MAVFKEGHPRSLGTVAPSMRLCTFRILGLPELGDIGRPVSYALSGLLEHMYVRKASIGPSRINIVTLKIELAGIDQVVSQLGRGRLSSVSIRNHRLGHAVYCSTNWV